MPKHEAGTPKAIANRIKAKGLQKLRWYCQMCQKQCRDENGFKCHTMSESHQRQLLLFAENPGKYIDTFSQEFADDFLELLRRTYGTKRVHANQVYQDYIADRHHLHMNSTQWETLTEFVKWMGREGKCKVDQTEKGWFVCYIDRDPESIQKQEAMNKKEKMDKDDQERIDEFISKQVERAKDQTKEEKPATHFTDLHRSNEEEKIVLRLETKSKDAAATAATAGTTTTAGKRKPMPTNAIEGKDVKDKDSKDKTARKEDRGEKRKKSALDEIMEEQELQKERANRKEYWLTEGVVVKVVTKSLGEKYYKKKGVVKEVTGLFLGLVKMLESGDVLKLDQAHVETVIPAQGRLVKVVNGAYRGSVAVLVDIHPDEFCCSVRINAGHLKGRVVKGVQYEDVSKLHDGT